MSDFDVILVVKVENVESKAAAEDEAWGVVTNDAVGGHISDVYVLKTEVA